MSSNLSDKINDCIIPCSPAGKECECWLNELQPPKPQRMSEADWLSLFPDAKEVVSDKIREWKEERARLIEEIKTELSAIYAMEESSRWFRREWLKLRVGPVLVIADGHIRRLRALLAPKDAPTHHKRSTELLGRAKSAPIIEIVRGQVEGLRRSGERYVAKCPFHEDRHPSFTLYPNDNSFHCFSCGRHGDGIDLAQELNSWDFCEAVERLASY